MLPSLKSCMLDGVGLFLLLLAGYRILISFLFYSQDAVNIALLFPDVGCFRKVSFV